MKKGLDAIHDKNSKILILGSLPSEKSIQNQEYYNNPTNHFWRILSNIFEGKNIDFENYESKKNFLSKHNIALWDVIKCAEREGSLDKNIKKEKYNNLYKFILENKIEYIFVNGNKAKTSLNKYLKENKIRDINFKTLPSSSAANTRYTLKEKIKIWKNIINQ